MQKLVRREVLWLLRDMPGCTIEFAECKIAEVFEVGVRTAKDFLKELGRIGIIRVTGNKIILPEPKAITTEAELNKELEILTVPVVV